MISGKRLRALSILHPELALPPEFFAHYMWPTSPSWTRDSRVGWGIRLKACTFLAGLLRDGLVELRRDDRSGRPGYILTEDGACLLGESGATRPAGPGHWPIGPLPAPLR